jgi:hypothetical protein
MAGEGEDQKLATRVWWLKLKEGGGLKYRCRLKNNIKVDVKEVG